jgi:phosphonatase-like hydrolase
MNYRLAVFDIAGTTVADPGFVAEAFIQAMQAEGHHLDAEQIRPLMGYPKPQAIARLLGEHADSAQIARIHGDFVQRMLDRYRHGDGIEALPGAEALFDTLRERGLRIGLNTGFSRDIADAIVQRLNWAERIDALVASDEVPQGRPAPYMIRTLMAACGVTHAGQVVKIGDTEVDIAEGRNAEVGLVVAVTTGAFSRAEIEPYQPDHIIDRLDELPVLLDLSSIAA